MSGGTTPMKLPLPPRPDASEAPDKGLEPRREPEKLTPSNLLVLGARPNIEDRVPTKDYLRGIPKKDYIKAHDFLSRDLNKLLELEKGAKDNKELLGRLSAEVDKDEFEDLVEKMTPETTLGDLTNLAMSYGIGESDLKAEVLSDTSGTGKFKPRRVIQELIADKCDDGMKKALLAYLKGLDIQTEMSRLFLYEGRREVSEDVLPPLGGVGGVDLKIAVRVYTARDRWNHKEKLISLIPEEIKEPPAALIAARKEGLRRAAHDMADLGAKLTALDDEEAELRRLAAENPTLEAEGEPRRAEIDAKRQEFQRLRAVRSRARSRALRAAEDLQRITNLTDKHSVPDRFDIIGLISLARNSGVTDADLVEADKVAHAELTKLIDAVAMLGHNSSREAPDKLHGMLVAVWSVYWAGATEDWSGGEAVVCAGYDDKTSCSFPCDDSRGVVEGESSPTRSSSRARCKCGPAIALCSGNKEDRATLMPDQSAGYRDRRLNRLKHEELYRINKILESLAKEYSGQTSQKYLDLFKLQEEEYEIMGEIKLKQGEGGPANRSSELIATLMTKQNQIEELGEDLDHELRGALLVLNNEYAYITGRDWPRYMAEDWPIYWENLIRAAGGEESPRCANGLQLARAREKERQSDVDELKAAAGSGPEDKPWPELGGVTPPVGDVWEIWCYNNNYDIWLWNDIELFRPNSETDTVREPVAEGNVTAKLNEAWREGYTQVVLKESETNYARSGDPRVKDEEGGGSVVVDFTTMTILTQSSGWVKPIRCRRESDRDAAQKERDRERELGVDDKEITPGTYLSFNRTALARLLGRALSRFRRSRTNAPDRVVGVVTGFEKNKWAKNNYHIRFGSSSTADRVKLGNLGLNDWSVEIGPNEGGFARRRSGVEMTPEERER